MASTMEDVGSELAPLFAPFFGLVSGVCPCFGTQADTVDRLVSLSQYVMVLLQALARH